MKKTTLRNAAFFLFLAIAAHVAAQPVRQIVSLAGEHGKNLLTRTFLPGNDLVYEYNTDLNRHAFLCQDPEQITNYLRYQLPLLVNHYGSVDYTVTDMKVVGNVCFFCGTMSELTDNPVSPSGQSADLKYTGYIGRIALDSAARHFFVIFPNPPIPEPQNVSLNIKVKFFKVKKTKSLEKMAVDIRGTDTLIALTGQTDSLITMPCITLIKNLAAPSEYETHFYWIDDSTEHFTDVAIGHKNIFTVSRFDGQHTSFGLRASNKLNAFTTDFIDEFKNLYTFDVGTMHPISSTYSYTWHPDDAEIHLVAAPMNNDVTVAREARKFNNPNDSSNYTEMVSLFHLSCSSTGSFSMVNAKTFPCHSATEPFLIEAQSVGYTDTIALLTSINDAQYIQSELMLFRWGSSSATLFGHYQQPASDMDVTPGRMSIVGQLPNSGSPYLYSDNPRDTSNGRPCYWVTHSSPISLTPMVVPLHTQSNCIKYAYNINLFTHFRVTPTSIAQQTICSDDRSTPTE